MPVPVNETTILQLQNDPSIEYVQPQITYKIDSVPNDSLVAEQWALKKIQAFDAWNITEGADSVIIGVIDTGIDYMHPDLKNKIYKNPGEMGLDANGNDKSSNGIDDDNNGFVDDYMGWDFCDRVGFPFDSSGGDYLTWDNNPMDEFFHGTFVAGIIGAETNNLYGIAGTAPKAKILNMRAFDATGNGEDDDVAAAILYAIKMKAKVINMSFGDTKFSYVLRDVLKYAYSRNVVLVASSGNEGKTQLHYPSGFSEVISVGNSTEDDYVAGNSDYGSTLDLVAPGTLILSTSLKNDYVVASGTSASAPFVSAAAALILSEKNFTNEEVKQILKSTADDINSPGWDLNSGAGRLNLFKALSVLSPARINFDFPKQDYYTNEDSIKVRATVLSPYFLSFSLSYGAGLNPENWIPLLRNNQRQVINENIFNLDISKLKDSIYTLRLTVNLNNGRTTEERINFFIERSAPKMELAGAGIIYYGDVSTIQGEIFTYSRAITRLYYREKGKLNFNFITLDGFAVNNQFYKQLHYGFVPKQLVKPDTEYEVYFEAENLVGLKDTLNDNGKYFVFKTEPVAEPVQAVELPYKLPEGNIFDRPVNFLSNNSDEVLFNEFYGGSDSIYFSLYQYDSGNLVKKDSIKNRFPIAVGDFNNNGKNDFLSSIGRTGFIDEQPEAGIFKFENKLTKDFYPILVNDINKDGEKEILSNDNDERLLLWKINNNLSVSPEDTLENYSTYGSGNIFPNAVYRNAVVADLNNDSTNEVWFADADGDLLSYYPSGGKYVKGDSVITGFRTTTDNIMAKGDYDGDGIEDLAVLFETNNIAPNHLLLIFNFKNNKFNLIFQKVFLDQASEFIGFGFYETYNTIKLVNLDNDKKDELVVNVFPYVYIFKNENNRDRLIYYNEGINSETIFSGDLNSDGVTEIALQTSSGTKFYQFSNSIKPVVPQYFSGYSIDSSKIKLSWKGSAQRYLIYKGNSADSVTIYDSTTALTYIDSQVKSNKSYFYKIKSFDASKESNYSDISRTLNIFSHQPAMPIGAICNSPNTVLIEFSGKINNTIENLKSFDIANVGIPNSVSAASQKSYLLTFKNLPIGERKLIIKDMRDFYGSPIPEDTIFFTVKLSVHQMEFYISSFKILSPYNIKVMFNSNVDPQSVMNLDNYSFTPENHASSVKIDPLNHSIIYISTENYKPVGSIGLEYNLHIENVKSVYQVPISEGAGSYIVLTDFAKDLSDVYVYPSPVKISSSNSKMTFANLPKHAKISIWNISGKRIFELEENDGNGGVDYNLLDENGVPLSSGIYFYRVVRLDDLNNEVEEKLGKFAVLK